MTQEDNKKKRSMTRKLDDSQWEILDKYDDCIDDSDINLLKMNDYFNISKKFLTIKGLNEWDISVLTAISSFNYMMTQKKAMEDSKDYEERLETRPISIDDICSTLNINSKKHKKTYIKKVNDSIQLLEEKGLITIHKQGNRAIYIQELKQEGDYKGEYLNIITRSFFQLTDIENVRNRISLIAFYTSI